MKAAKQSEIETELRRLVNTVPVGTKLPTERHLAAVHQCNCLTVRTAMKVLVDEGIIHRRVGSGTFVAAHHVQSGSFATDPTGKRIGVLVHADSDAYAHKLLQGVARAAAGMGITLRTGWVKGFEGDASKQAHLLKQDGCIAITLPWFPHGDAAHVRAFVAQSPLPISLPLVIPGLEKNYFGDPATYGLNVIASSEALCRYFRALGHNRIALLGPQAPRDSILQMMLGAYTCFVAQERLPCLCGLVSPQHQSMDQLAAEWKHYAGDLAIVSYDDEHALRLLTSMHKLGLGAPKDFCIVGHNDTGASRFSDPPLTTIHEDFVHMGTGLLRSAVALANGRTEHDTDSSPPRLMVRESCGGRARITEAFKLQFPELTLMTESPAPAPAVAHIS